MTIRKQWLIVLILVAVFSVSVNALVLSTLTDRYFIGYMTEDYEKNFSQIIAYSKKALTQENFSIRQMAIELETHLDDPITRIKLYDVKGQLIVDIGNENSMMSGMKNKGMFGRMINIPFEEVDNTQIFDGNNLIGQLNVTRYSSVENSIARRMFKAALISNSLISIAIVLVFAILLGILVSKKTSQDLIQTAALAQNIELGNYANFQLSKTKEIRMIQQSLETLKSKLKLKQKSRKNLIDELVHQSRTPLTILKNHLEGFEDGIIELTSEEIKICEEQIENITSIIGNMGSMIDAEKEEGTIAVEEFEFNQLLKQIIGGLKVQFAKKDIDLMILSQHKVALKTDKYKLSQAIYNILTNAYKYTDSQGKVSITYETQNDELAIIIEDNGKGISQDEQKKIFDAYYRSSSVKNISGDGIGLYVAQENLHKINGTITVESELGVGSKFVIKIPTNNY